MKNATIFLITVVVWLSTYNRSNAFSDITCGSPDGIDPSEATTIDCWRLTIVEVERINSCEVRFRYFLQTFSDWKGRINPPDSAFDGIKKVRKPVYTFTANCCKRLLDSWDVDAPAKGWDNPRGVWNDVCRKGGF